VRNNSPTKFRLPIKWLPVALLIVMSVTGLLNTGSAHAQTRVYPGSICNVEFPETSLRRISYELGSAVNISPNTLTVVCPIEAYTELSNISVSFNVENRSMMPAQFTCRVFEYSESGSTVQTVNYSDTVDGASLQRFDAKEINRQERFSQLSAKCFLPPDGMIQTVVVSPSTECSLEELAGQWQVFTSNTVEDFGTTCTYDMNDLGTIEGGMCQNTVGDELAIVGGSFVLGSSCNFSGQLMFEEGGDVVIEFGAFDLGRRFVHGVTTDSFGTGQFTGTKR
jgi:hypothetical protein